MGYSQITHFNGISLDKPTSDRDTPNHMETSSYPLHHPFLGRFQVRSHASGPSISASLSDSGTAVLRTFQKLHGLQWYTWPVSRS